MNNKVIYNIIIAFMMISIIFLYFQVNRANSKTENFVSQLSSSLLKTQMHSYILLNKKIDFDSIEAFGKGNTKNRIENPHTLYIIFSEFGCDVCQRDDEFTNVIAAHIPITGNPEFSEPFHFFCKYYFDGI